MNPPTSDGRFILKYQDNDTGRSYLREELFKKVKSKQKKQDRRSKTEEVRQKKQDRRSKTEEVRQK